MLCIRLELESLSTVIPQMNDQAAEDNLGLRNEVMDNLAQHQSGVQASLEQVYNQVDQRISKVEDLLEKQGDQVQSEQEMQFGTVYHPRPLYRRRRSSESILSYRSAIRDI